MVSSYRQKAGAPIPGNHAQDPKTDFLLLQTPVLV